MLPAVTRFGGAAEKWLLEGLKSKKSFMRQGCALALGTLKTPAAIDALCKLLVDRADRDLERGGARARRRRRRGGDAARQAGARGRPRRARPRRRGAGARRGARRGRARARRSRRWRRGATRWWRRRRSGRWRASPRCAPPTPSCDGRSKEGTVVRGFSRRFYDVLGGASGDTGAIELSAGRARGGRRGRGVRVRGRRRRDRHPHQHSGSRRRESTSPTPEDDLAAEAGLSLQSKIARS